MLQPKKTKFRRQHRLRSQRKGIATRGAKISFGEMGIKVVQSGEISARQIESARRTIARAVKRGGKIWICIFPDKVVTAKGAEVPMGSGKGAPDRWVASVRRGRILFEIAGAEKETMKKALKLATYKLPLKCKIVTTEI